MILITPHSDETPYAEQNPAANRSRSYIDPVDGPMSCVAKDDGLIYLSQAVVPFLPAAGLEPRLKNDVAAPRMHTAPSERSTDLTRRSPK